MLFLAIVILISLVRALWPPKEEEFRLPKGCKSMDEYIEVCVLWERLTEKQKQECEAWARGERK